MGMLFRGELIENWLDHEMDKGDFKRMASTFRHWITPDGKAGITGKSGFKAEKNRYHLYISNACPWAHRTLIFRKLKGLEDCIGLSIVEPDMLDQGWTFSSDGAYQEHLYHYRFMHQLYTKADKNFTGQITVPVLWDKKLQTIVNNESSEIIRMFNSAFNTYTDIKTDYYPIELQDEINAINQSIYENINNGVYRCGFATSQSAYETAFDKLFNELDKLEKRLSQQAYLVGQQITEADWRLFTTLIRFDSVYVGHFKCNLKRISDYHHLSNYLRELYQHPGIAQTINFKDIKRHYYYSHTKINPTQIIAKGPAINFDLAHDRGDLYS